VSLPGRWMAWQPTAKIADTPRGATDKADRSPAGTPSVGSVSPSLWAFLDSKRQPAMPDEWPSPTPLDPEVRWRLEAMAPQVPKSGPIRGVLSARSIPNHADGMCLSCGDPLRGDAASTAFRVPLRCQPCRKAAMLLTTNRGQRTEEPDCEFR
jgi:hypothetical protein